jgi:hypothetical protein
VKIGIMTMQRIPNYGSFLQAYGLKKVIEELGHEVEFVDYIAGPAIVENKISPMIEKTIVERMIRKLGIIFCFTKEKRKIAHMYKKISLFFKTYSKTLLLLGVNSKKNYHAQVDVLVIGSDEVFNVLQGNDDVGYSLELFGKDNCGNKLISYAASFGNVTYEKLHKYQVDVDIAQLLLNFDSISVRDSNSKDIVQILTGKDALIHLDPVLISDFSNEMKYRVKDKNYIIVYSYSNRINEEEGKAIREFAKKKNKKLICIQGVQEFCDKFIYGNPFEILCYFKNADYIITDTFHGSIFSIINHKPFLSIVRNSINGKYGNEEKLLFLLTKLGLEDRILNDLGKIEELMEIPINYCKTDHIRCIERNRSIAYLKRHLTTSYGEVINL